MIDYAAYMKESLFNHLGNALFVAVVFSVMMAEIRQKVNLEDLSNNNYAKIALFILSYFVSMSIALIGMIALISFMWILSNIFG